MQTHKHLNIISSATCTKTFHCEYTHALVLVHFIVCWLLAVLHESFENVIFGWITELISHQRNCIFWQSDLLYDRMKLEKAKPTSNKTQWIFRIVKLPNIHLSYNIFIQPKIEKRETEWEEEERRTYAHLNIHTRTHPVAVNRHNVRKWEKTRMIFVHGHIVLLINNTVLRQLQAVEKEME